MIGHNIPEEHERTRSQLAESVARFLAEGGKIQDCTGAGSVPRPPGFRRYQAPLVPPVAKAPPAPVVEQSPAVPKPPARQARRETKRQARAEELDALLQQIRAYAHTSLSRGAVAKVLNISPQRLTKLVDEHSIDFPRWRRNE